MNGRQWQIPELTYLWRTYPDMRTDDIARALGRGTPGVYAKAKQLGLSKSDAYNASPLSGRNVKGYAPNGMRTRFQKGSVPPNKGLRRPGWAPGRMASTQFKKGTRPHTWKPIGSYRINGDGYLDQKVTDDGPPQKHWVGVHRLVWMRANGSIPPGHAVTFKKGRRTTELSQITIDALELVSRQELLRRNYHDAFPLELKQLVQLRGAISRQINRRAREKQDSGSA